jgi:hypothetical protein
MVNEEQLQAIEARYNAATMGSWSVVERGGGDCGYDITPTHSGLRGQFERVEDAQFIACARQDIPALVAEVRRLTGVIRRIQDDIYRLSRQSVWANSQGCGPTGRRSELT